MMATEASVVQCQNCSYVNVTMADDWLEEYIVAGFTRWQIMFFCLFGLLVIVVLLCCCFRFRIPRTKQEIEADYIRKKIAKKFEKQLRYIQNAEMDEMDLKRALDRIRAEFKSDTESIVRSEVPSILSTVQNQQQLEEANKHDNTA